MSKEKICLESDFEIGQEFFMGPDFRSPSRGNNWRYGVDVEPKSFFLVEKTRKFFIFSTEDPSIKKEQFGRNYKFEKKLFLKNDYPIMQHNDDNMGIYLYKDIQQFNLFKNGESALQELKRYLQSNKDEEFYKKCIELLSKIDK